MIISEDIKSDSLQVREAKEKSQPQEKAKTFMSGPSLMWAAENYIPKEKD